MLSRRTWLKLLPWGWTLAKMLHSAYAYLGLFIVQKHCYCRHVNFHVFENVSTDKVLASPAWKDDCKQLYIGHLRLSHTRETVLPQFHWQVYGISVSSLLTTKLRQIRFLQVLPTEGFSSLENMGRESVFHISSQHSLLFGSRTFSVHCSLAPFASSIYLSCKLSLRIG